MKKLAASVVLAGAILAGQTIASQAASIVARVSLSTQTMTVTENGVKKYTWRVSTARPGKVTPKGAWSAKWLSKNHRSSRYNNAPMPYAIFYSGNFAVHGTDQVNRLGRPASAGCVRLDTANAAKLFSMTQRAGLKNVRIVVQN